MTDLELALRRVETRAAMLEQEISRLEDVLRHTGLALEDADQRRLADWLEACDVRAIALLRAYGWSGDVRPPSADPETWVP